MPMTSVLPRAVLLLVFLLIFAHAQADDLKDISQLASQGQQAAALDRINAYLAANPKDVQALFMKGVILAELSRRDEAIKVFTELTEKHPNLPEPYNNLAVLYADQGQYDKARKALETAIKTHPSYATAHENLGDIYARMASEAYDKALQLDNGNTRAQNKLSLIKDLFSSTGKPIQLASKSSPAGKEATAPVLPIRPAEPAKPLESKPVVPKATKPEKAAEAPKPEPKEASIVENEDKEITLAVQNWAKAWSSKKVDKYLASYGDNFQTSNGESRKEWEELRRERISKPASINVEITKIRIKMENPNQAKVSFKQHYRAGSLAKHTSKTLVMQKTDGKWLIEQELTDS